MSFEAKITANISNFQAGMRDAVAETERASKTMKERFSQLSTDVLKVGGAMSAFSAAVVGVGAAMYKMGISAGEASAKINNLSTATGLSTDTIQELAYVANASNSSFEGLQKTIGSFQRRLREVGDEGDANIATLHSLGVATRDASGAIRSMDDVLVDTLSAMGDLPDGLEKSAIGTRLFGRSWHEASLIASSGAQGIADLREEAHALGMVLEGDILDAADRFATSMHLIGEQVKTLKNRIGAELAPLMEETIVPLFQEKIIPAFSRFADRISNVIESFNNLSPSLKNTIIGAAGLTAALGPMLLGLGGVMKMLPLITAGFSAITGPVGIAAAAIAGGAALVVANWDVIKEYFTTGAGAELFDNIKRLATTLYENLKLAFTSIKDSVLAIWDAIGDTVMAIWRGTFQNVITIVSTAIGAVADILEGLGLFLQGDFKGSMNAFGNFFKGIFEGLRDVVLNTVASMAEAIGNLLKFLKLETWGEGMISWAKELRPEMGMTKKVIDDTTESVKRQKEAIEKLTVATGGLAAQQLALRDVGAVTAGAAGTVGVAMKMIPEIDTTLIEGAMGDISEGISVLTVDLQEMLTTSLTDIIGAVSTALMEGDNVMGALGSSLLGTLGGVMVDLGKMVMSTGSAIEAVKTALIGFGGIGAIAAGAALVTIGSLFSAGARKLGSSMGAGAGYSYGGGYGTTGSMVTPTYGESDYRGAYKDDFKVEFKIGTDELTAVLDTAEQKKNRL